MPSTSFIDVLGHVVFYSSGIIAFNTFNSRDSNEVDSRNGG
jgi:hypothetical protein